MKIKLAILEIDKSYLNRMVSGFGMRYAENLELYSFTDPDVAMNTLKSAKIDVLLASDAFDIDIKKLPNRCAFAYLVDSSGISTLNEQRAICKFQKADQLYKQILGVYSEKASSITGIHLDNGECAIIAFSSASGGVGSSTIAASCAVHFAAMGKKTLYLNLEKFGSSDLFFSGQGQSDLSDIIYTLRRGKSNLTLKLESCVKQDRSGVFFYSAAKNAMDMTELTNELTLRLISELKTMCGYEYIILDTDFGIDKDAMRIYNLAQALILVGDGSVESNTKTERAYQAIEIIESGKDASLINRMAFIYNGVSSNNGLTLNVSDIRILGGTHRYTGGSTQQIIDQLAKKDLFDKIF